MLRKPSYCCNCGDRVERIEWHLWNSRRYCELCETEFVFDEWWPRGVVFALVLFGFTGVGFHLSGDRRPARPEIRNLSAPVRPVPADVKATSTGIKRETPETGKKREPAASEKSSVRVEPQRRESRGAGGNEQPPGTEPTPGTISYCGALTKKGKPCSRRVKGGGRCWQHSDSPR